jgi:hypothetical protein
MTSIPDLSKLRGQGAAVKPVEKFQLKIHGLAPEDIYPNGDRYVVETIEVDEAMEFGSLLVVSGLGDVPDAQRKPWEKGMVEKRGVFPAVIVTVGNGHLLGLPDWPSRGAGTGEIMAPSRSKAEVPMFFESGQVVFVDYNAKGRSLRMIGREVRIVNQIDVLASLPIEKVRLERHDGVWVQVQG